MLRRARFGSVEPKLLSGLLTASRLLTGPAPFAFESLPLPAKIQSPDTPCRSHYFCGDVLTFARTHFARAERVVA